MFKRTGAPVPAEKISFGEEAKVVCCDGCKANLGKVSAGLLKPAGKDEMIRSGGIVECPQCGKKNIHV